MKNIPFLLKCGSSLANMPTNIVASLALSVAGLGIAPAAMADSTLPQGGVTTLGENTFTYNGNHLEINQNTNTSVVVWGGGFNIGSDASVNTAMPGSGSRALYKDTTGHISTIAGSLTSNGTIILYNPNGAFITSGGTVSTHGFIATTADIDNDQHIGDNRLVFNKPGAPAASIVNKGTITAEQGGLVALLAPGVANDGVIEVNTGTVGLGAGNAFTVDFYGDKLYSFTVDEKTNTKAKDQNGTPLTSAISNTGAIKAEGGTIYMTANVAKDIVDKAINTSGIVDASSAHMDGGAIVLDGGDGAVNIAGIVDASGKGAGHKGGNITVTGKTINLAANAQVRAAGNTHGGTVKIGGDARGQGTLAHADYVTVADGAVIDASAVSGDAGNVVFWSDKNTDFHGKIDISSAEGHGGLAEVSSKDQLTYAGFTDARGATGFGTLLLDPGNWTISSAATGANTYNATQLATALNSSNIIINTANAGAVAGNLGDINVNSAVTWNGAGNLTLTAGHNLNVNALVQSTNASGAKITVNAIDVALTGTGALRTNGALAINNTGKFSSTASNVLSGYTVDLNQNTLGSLQNAIDAIGTHGGLATVHAGAGTYNEAVNINEKNLTLTGQGASTIIAPTSGTAGIWFTGINNDNVTVSNLTVDGRNTEFGVLVQNARNTRLDNVTVANSQAFGVAVQNASKTTLDNVTLANNQRYGLFYQRSTDLDVRGGSITGNGTGAYITDANNTTFNNVQVTNGVGINFSTNTLIQGGGIDSLTLTHHADNTTVDSANLGDVRTDNSSNLTFTKNTFGNKNIYVYAANGVNMSDNTGFGDISFNSVMNGTINHNTGGAISYTGGFNATIANNTTDGITATYVSGNSGNGTITGNTVGASGITTSGSNISVISGNTITGIGTGAAITTDAADVNVTGNTIHDFHDALIISGDNARVSSNTADQVDNGATVTGDNVYFANNSFTGNDSGTGVIVNGVSDFYGANNTITGFGSGADVTNSTNAQLISNTLGNGSVNVSNAAGVEVRDNTGVGAISFSNVDLASIWGNTGGAISYTGGSYATITGNTTDGITATDVAGGVIIGNQTGSITTSGGSISDIRYNTVTNFVGDGINTHDTVIDHLSFNTVTGNTASGTGISTAATNVAYNMISGAHNGLYFTGSYIGNFSSTTSNTITGDGTGTGTGISLSFANRGGGRWIGDGTLAGANTVSGFGTGINVDNSSVNVILNTLNNNGTAIALSGHGSDGNLVLSNIIDGSTNGVTSSGVNGVNVSGNTLTNIAHDGIAIQDGDSSNVIANSVTATSGNTGTGISFQNQTGINNIGDSSDSGKNSTSGFGTGINVDNSSVSVNLNTLNNNGTAIALSGHGSDGSQVLSNIIDGSTNGVTSSGVNGVTVSGNTLTNIAHDGIAIQDGDSSNVIANSVTATSGNTGTGISFQNQTGTNSIGDGTDSGKNSTSGFSTGYSLDHTTANIVKNSSAGDHTGFSVANGSNGSLLQGNTGDNNTIGIEVTNSNNVVADTNTITHVSNIGTGIYSYKTDNLSLISNDLSSTSGSNGIWLDNQSTNVKVGNTTGGANKVSGFGVGIEMGGQNNGTIAGNKLNNNQNAILIAGGNGPIGVDSNEIDGGHNGILLQNTRDVSVTGNTLTHIGNSFGGPTFTNSNFGDGIDVYNSTGTILTGNNVAAAAGNTTGYGINVTDSTGTFVGKTGSAVNAVSGFDTGVKSSGGDLAGVTGVTVTGANTGIDTGNSIITSSVDHNNVTGKTGATGAGIKTLGNVTDNTIAKFNDAIISSGDILRNTATGVVNGITEQGNGKKIAGNTMTGTDLGNGLILNGVNNVTVADDTTTPTAIPNSFTHFRTGAQVSNSTGVTFDGGSFKASGKGLQLINAQATLNGVTFDGAATSYLAVDGASSGLTLGATANQFGTTPSSGGTQFIVLTDNALQGQTLNVETQIFEGTNASDFTNGQITDAKSRTIDFATDNTVGTVFYKTPVVIKTPDVPNTPITPDTQTNNIIRTGANNGGGTTGASFSVAGQIGSGSAFTPGQTSLSLLSPSAGGGTGLGDLSPAAGGDLGSLEPSAGGDKAGDKYADNLENCANSALADPSGKGDCSTNAGQ